MFITIDRIVSSNSYCLLKNSHPKIMMICSNRCLTINPKYKSSGHLKKTKINLISSILLTSSSTNILFTHLITKVDLMRRRKKSKGGREKAICKSRF